MLPRLDMFNRVRGRTWGAPVYTFHLNSDTGYAVLLPILLGVPVSIGEAVQRPWALQYDRVFLCFM